MSDGKSMAELLDESQLRNVKKAGDAFVEKTVGHYVTETIKAGREISTEGLRAWLKSQIATTLFTQGKVKEKDDLAHQMLDGALRFLDSAAPPTCDK